MGIRRTADFEGVRWIEWVQANHKDKVRLQAQVIRRRCDDGGQF